MRQTTHDCKMINIPETLRAQLTGFAFLAWNTASESIVLDFANIGRCGSCHPKKIAERLGFCTEFELHLQ